MRFGQMPFHRSTFVESLEDRRLCALHVQFDYSLDTTGFFASQQRRDVMTAAAHAVTSRITDQFSAITPSGTNTDSVSFTNPTTRQSITINNLNFPADTIVVYPGSSAQADSQVADSQNFAVNGSGTDSWQDNLNTRGRGSTYSKFSPTGGMISFSSNRTWFDSLNVTGLSGSTSFDMLTVAEHELGHLLGFGTSASFNKYVSNSDSTFTGPASESVYGGPVPLRSSSDLEHWNASVLSDGQPVTMTELGSGQRKTFTRLDFAGLQDTGYSFSSTAAGSISGFYWGDDNANGVRDAGESGQAGKVMYLDTNLNGTLDTNEPSTVTATDGSYLFTGLTGGTYRVRRSGLPAGYRLTTPVLGFDDVTVATGATVAGQDFLTTSRSAIVGTYFGDSNANGVFDSGETGQADKTMYLDTNNNGVLDSGEPTAVTDANGFYRFDNLAAGTYHVRRYNLPAGFRLTTPSNGVFNLTVNTGQLLGNVNFGVTYA